MVYDEPPAATKAGVGEPGGHGLKVGDSVQVYGHEGKHTVSSVSDLGVILTDDEGHKLDVAPEHAAQYLTTGHWKKAGGEVAAKTPAKIVAKKAKGWTIASMESKNQQGEPTDTHKGILHESGLFVHHKAGSGETEYSEAEHSM